MKDKCEDCILYGLIKLGELFEVKCPGNDKRDCAKIKQIGE